MPTCFILEWNLPDSKRNLKKNNLVLHVFRSDHKKRQSDSKRTTEIITTSFLIPKQKIQERCVVAEKMEEVYKIWKSDLLITYQKPHYPLIAWTFLATKHKNKTCYQIKQENEWRGRKISQARTYLGEEAERGRAAQQTRGIFWKRKGRGRAIASFRIQNPPWFSLSRSF